MIRQKDAFTSESGAVNDDGSSCGTLPAEPTKTEDKTANYRGDRRGLAEGSRRHWFKPGERHGSTPQQRLSAERLCKTNLACNAISDDDVIMAVNVLLDEVRAGKPWAHKIFFDKFFQHPAQRTHLDIVATKIKATFSAEEIAGFMRTMDEMKPKLEGRLHDLGKEPEPSDDDEPRFDPDSEQ
jgi:hypothetical protein